MTIFYPRKRTYHRGTNMIICASWRFLEKWFYESLRTTILAEPNLSFSSFIISWLICLANLKLQVLAKWPNLIDPYSKFSSVDFVDDFGVTMNFPGDSWFLQTEISESRVRCSFGSLEETRLTALFGTDALLAAANRARSYKKWFNLKIR